MSSTDSEQDIDIMEKYGVLIYVSCALISAAMIITVALILKKRISFRLKNLFVKELFNYQF